MVKEELYIDNQRVELLESLNPNLTFNIADIAKPDTRKADFSKTITLPGSKAINKIFEHSFEVNLSLQTFNPNLKTSVVYLVDGEINIDGYLQLKQINVTDTDDITYEVTIIGRIGDFITEVGNAYLTDLDLSGLNHVYNKANQLATWVTNIQSLGYVYPMINYDRNYGSSSNPETWDVTDFYPAITVKKYVDEIFAAANYTYTSAFFDDDFFESLIVPYNAKDFKLTGAEVDNRIYKADTTEWLTSGTVNFGLTERTMAQLQNRTYESDRIVFTNEIFDVGTNYDPATGVFTVPATGYYNFTVSVQLKSTFSPSGASEDVTVRSAILGNLELRNYNLGGGSYTVLDTSETIGMVYESAAHATASSAQYIIPASSTGTTANSPSYSVAREYRRSYQTGISQSGSTYAIGLNTGNRAYDPMNVYTISVNNVFLLATDEISVYGNFLYGALKDQLVVTSYPDGTGVTGQLFESVSSAGVYYGGAASVALVAGAFFNQVANPTFQEGNTITMNTSIPTKIKQKDFFMGLVNMFNLYVQSDTSNDRNLIIEPKEDFYLDGAANSVDWSLKLDKSQQLELLPMAALDAKDYSYNYKQDKDYYNKLYNETWDVIYGEKLYDSFVNDFLKNTKKMNVIFSPTPSVGQAWYDRVIPTIIKTDNNGQVQRTESNIRILQWSDVKSTDNMWFHRDLADVAAGASGTAKTNYPYSGMYNDPYSPTIDLGFGLTREIFWDNHAGVITLTDNNLFNKYHLKFIEEITDKDSKIVKGWFYLKPTDIRDLSFRKLFWFENAYFRLNKIENYNPNSPITKCEFFKVKDVDIFQPTTAIINNGVSLINGFPAPGFSSGNSELRNGNSVGNLNNTVRGSNNYVNRSSSNVVILGDDNRVYSDCKNINIQGTGNIIESSVQNISLINTDNVTVADSGEVYVNNTRSGVGSILTVTANTHNATEDIETYLCDTTSNNVRIYLPNTTNMGQLFICKIIEASNDMDVTTPGGTVTIDGATNQNTSTLNTTFRCLFDGANYQLI